MFFERRNLNIDFKEYVNFLYTSSLPCSVSYRNNF